MLQVFLGLTALVLAYIYRGVFIPAPEGAMLPPPAVGRVLLAPSVGAALYARQEFKDLRRFGDLPVKPHSAGGSNEPFITETR